MNHNHSKYNQFIAVCFELFMRSYISSCDVLFTCIFVSAHGMGPWQPESLSQDRPRGVNLTVLNVLNKLFMVKCLPNITVACRYRYLQMICYITNIGFRDIGLSGGRYLGIDNRLSVLPRFACYTWYVLSRNFYLYNDL